MVVEKKKILFYLIKSDLNDSDITKDTAFIHSW